MLRTTVYLEEETSVLLRYLAAVHGRSQADLIREAIDTYVAQLEKQQVRGHDVHVVGDRFWELLHGCVHPTSNEMEPPVPIVVRIRIQLEHRKAITVGSVKSKRPLDYFQICGHRSAPSRQNSILAARSGCPLTRRWDACRSVDFSHKTN